MAWQNVSFLTDAASAEPLCDALIELGALSASIEDADAGTADERPQFGEPGTPTTPGWQRSRVLALCWLDFPLIFGQAFPVETASVSILGREKESWAVLRWNS